MILRLARQNLGVGVEPGAQNIMSMAQEATQALVRDAGRRHVTPDVAIADVEPNFVYSGEEVVARAEAKKAKVAAEKKAKKDTADAKMQVCYRRCVLVCSLPVSFCRLPVFPSFCLTWA